MDTKSVIARFEAVAASRGADGIIRISPTYSTRERLRAGRPYFVMELVEGVKITEYCDRHSLSINDRLGLFVQVCDAIQHAIRRESSIGTSNLPTFS